MYVAGTNVARIRDSHLFVKTRARLQRCSDMKFFSGWIVELFNERATIQIKADAEVIHLGDLFSVEAAGKERMAVFIGETAVISEATIVLRLPSGVATIPTKESARVNMYGHQGHLIVDGEELAFTLLDFSENGIGVITTTTVEEGAKISFDANTPHGPITGSGEVRHCRPEPGTEGRFCVGIVVDHQDRLGKARWMHLLSKVWEG